MIEFPTVRGTLQENQWYFLSKKVGYNIIENMKYGNKYFSFVLNKVFVAAT